MRILFLSHRIPYPPDKGDKIRSYHLLAHLARRGTVDLVTHVDDPRDLRHREVLADMCRSVQVFPLNPLVGRLRALAALPGSSPLSVAWMTRPAAARAVQRHLAAGSHDVVVAFSSQAAAYVPTGGPPLVMDLVDVDSEKFAAFGESRRGVTGIVDRIEARRLRGFERELGRRAHRIVLTTGREVALYREKVGPAALVAIPNGVALPDSVAPAAARQAGLMVFVGAMDYEANIEAAETGAREVLPLVRSRIPGAVFRIVGRNPAPRVKALASIEGVEVTGEVPDPGRHLQEAAIALVPLRVARGIQNKVLEALAAGLPVVATPDVLASLEAGAGAAVRTGADPAALAAAAADLLSDPAGRQRCGDSARGYVREHHDWRSFDAAWDGILDGILVPAGSGRAA